ncbi:hypothetical protein J6590_039838 [Homalodisca vitripennis]|nr:hypothetical protein J6590_039838 [Homalodisca vitripennis]
MPYSMTSEQKERALSLILVTGPAIKCGIHVSKEGRGREGRGWRRVTAFASGRCGPRARRLTATTTTVRATSVRPGPPVAPGPYAFAPLAPCPRACMMM